MSITNLFKDDKTSIEIQKFHSLVSNSAEDFRFHEVQSIFYVRDLCSLDRHEVLEVAIYDQDTGNQSRLIAERLKDQDQVSLSPWWPSKDTRLLSSSGSQRRCPLPLSNVTFGSGDLKFLDFVKILTEVNNIGTEYDLLSGNSYWFVMTAYKALKLKFNGREERTRFFFGWRERLVSYKKSLEEQSDEFNDERNSLMRWAPCQPAPDWEFLEEVYKAVIRFTNTEDEADELIEENLTSYIMGDMDEKKTLSVMEATREPASLSSSLDLDQVYQHAQEVDNVDDFIDSYNAQQENADRSRNEDDSTLIPEGFQVAEPTEEEKKKIDYVVQVMAGQAIHDF